jgi:two-component system, chemotaxis family, response regulator Rcp1
MANVRDHKVRLLMVEDNPGDVELFRWALKRAEIDCELSVIGDGGEALALLQREEDSSNPAIPDLVILDLNLPKEDGREVLARMRSSHTFAEVPVVVMTSSASPQEREQLKPLRVARHITKPSDLNEFLKIASEIEKVLKERS